MIGIRKKNEKKNVCSQEKVVTTKKKQKIREYEKRNHQRGIQLDAGSDVTIIQEKTWEQIGKPK